MALTGSVDPALLYALGEQSAQLGVGAARQFARLSGAFSDATGADPEDAALLLTGEYGLVVSEFPLLGDDERRATAFLGVRDEAAVGALLQRASDDLASGESRETEGVLIHTTGVDSTPFASVYSGFLWFSTDSATLAEIIRGETPRLRETSREAYGFVRSNTALSLYAELEDAVTPAAAPLVPKFGDFTLQTEALRQVLATRIVVGGDTDQWRISLLDAVLAAQGVERGTVAVEGSPTVVGSSETDSDADGD